MVIIDPVLPDHPYIGPELDRLPADGFVHTGEKLERVVGLEDAAAVVESGAAAIAVSNHGGRVLDHTPGVAEVLPSIAKEVGNSTMIIADGGIRSGYDVLKMLALGADAVLIGRDIVRAAVGDGIDGVHTHMSYIGEDLAKAMKMTGCKSLKDISQEILY